MKKMDTPRLQSILWRPLSYALVFAAIVSLFTTASPIGAASPLALSINTGSVVQGNFLGANAIYHGYAYMPDSGNRVLTEEQRNIEYGRIDDMDLKIARTYYNYEYAWETEEGGHWNWNNQKMLAFYAWLQDMKDRNVDVAINASWWAPGDLNSTLDWKNNPNLGYAASPFTVYNADHTVNWDATVQKYAAWVSDSLYQMIQVRGFTNIKYIMIFTEPNNAQGTLPAGKTANTTWRDCVAAVHNKLVADGRRSLVKIVGPDEGSTTTSAMLQYATQNANSYVDIYSSHNYIWNWSTFYDSYNDWYTWASTAIQYANAVGKPFWFDEYGVANETLRWSDGLYGTQLALAQTAFMNAGAQSSLLWTLFDQQWPDSHNTGDSFYDGVQKWGTAPTPRQSNVPYKAYYAFSMISKYMGGGEGTKVYATTSSGGVHLSASRQPDGNWNVLVVNSNSTSQDISVTFSSAINKTLYRHLYNPSAITASADAKIIRADAVKQDVSTVFTDTLPAYGVAVYTSVPDEIEAESYTSVSGVALQSCSEGGQSIVKTQDGAYAVYNNVAFGGGFSSFTARGRSGAGNGKIEVYLDSLAGSPVGSCILGNTGSGLPFTTASCNLGAAATGSHNVYLKFSGSVELDWFRLEAKSIGNMVMNPGFEADGGTGNVPNPAGWSKWADTGNLDAIYSETAQPHFGARNLKHYKATAYQASSYQNITGLKNGLYTLKAWVKSSGGQNQCWISAKNYGGGEMEADVPGTGAWTQVCVTNIPVTLNRAQIVLWSDANAGNYVVADDFEFYRQNFQGNFLFNSSFEADSGTDSILDPLCWLKWTDTGNANASYTETLQPHIGTRDLCHYKATAYQASTYQNVTGLPNGLYTLRVWVKSSGGQTQCTLFAKNYGGSDLSTNITATSTYTQITIPNINVTNGKCTVGVWSNASIGNWMAADDFELFRQ